MSRRTSRADWAGRVLLALAPWTLAAATACAGAPAAERKPNIVYFIIDELGYYELSLMGHPEFKTPNIDRLAAEGLRFTQFLAGSSVCAPTRACLMTGKHAGHSSLRTNGGWEAIRAGEATLASMLKAAGYACGGFGKWGCGARGTSGVPETHGFDLFFGYYDQVHAHTFFPTYLVRNSQEVPLQGNTGDARHGQTFSQYLIFEQSKDFLRRHKDRPFFLYLPWTPPHGQWGIPADDPSWQLYKDKPRKAGRQSEDDAKIYAAMVNLVDRQVGEIMALLKQLGLDQDTIVFFSGDNGGYTYFASPEHPAGLFGPNVDPKTGKRFRGAKGNLYEGGLRVPFLVRWPGRIEPGRVSHHLGYFPDIMPTLAELAGADCPKDTDGISIVPTLLGEQAAGRKQRQHEFLYWELGGQAAVRQGDWKAVRPRPNAPWELYDLGRDVEEQQDLADRHADVLARLTSLAEKAHQPMEPGLVYDQSVVDRDRTIPLGRPYPPAPRKAKPKRSVSLPLEPECAAAWVSTDYSWPDVRPKRKRGPDGQLPSLAPQASIAHCPVQTPQAMNNPD